jgi:uncharacterized protein
MDVTLVLTHDCNLACGYCYMGGHFRRVMPWDVAARSLDLAFRDDARDLQVSFFGGEPLLEWDLLVRAAEAARARAAAESKNLRMVVTTNGTLLSPERTRRLADLDVYVALSIDGDREAHDATRPRAGGGSSFDDVVRGLDALVAVGVPFETISVVAPPNVARLGRSVRFLFDRGAPRVSLNPCYEAAWSSEDLALWEKGLEESAAVMMAWMRAGRLVSISVFDNKILAALKGGLGAGDKCPLGEESVAVSPEGHLYGCERLVAEDEDPRFRIGHLDTGVRRASVAEQKGACGPSNAECSPCGERDRCGAFCACANLAETGTIGAAGGVQCWHERATARIADRMAEVLFAEENPVFLEWFYGRMGALPRSAAPRRAAGAVPMKKRLAVVQPGAST